MRLRKTDRYRFITAIVCFIAFALLFQNCSGGFQIEGGDGFSSLSSEGSSLPTEDVPVNPTADLMVYARQAIASDGPLNFSVVLNKAHTTDISVQVETIAGQAVPMMDYQDLKSTFTIPAGQTEVTVPVKTFYYFNSLADKDLGISIVSSSAGEIAQKTARGVLKAKFKPAVFKSLAAGNVETCGLTEGNRVQCWGSSYYTLTGYSRKFSSSVPYEVADVGNVMALSQGSKYGMSFLGADNTLKGISYRYGILLNMPLTEVLVQSAGDSGPYTKAPDSGTVMNVEYVFCVLTNLGKVKCMGFSPSGLGNVGLTQSNAFVEIANLPTVKQIGAGYLSMCAVTVEGKVYCWGGGTPMTLSSPVPVEVSNLTDVKSLSVGGSASCAVLNSGVVKCLGNNSNGLFGNGNTTGVSNVPVEVPGVSNAQDVAAANFFACALIKDGTVKCWGRGNYISDTTSNAVLPPRDMALSNITQISAGASHVCALTAQKTTKCWGSNANGELGNSTTLSSYIPLDVSTVTGIQQLSSNGPTTCGITATGSVKCFGSNSQGQLGNGTLNEVATAVDVPGITDASEISVGVNYTCVLTKAGLIKCWGGQKFLTPVSLVNISGIKNLEVSGATLNFMTPNGQRASAPIAENPIISLANNMSALQFSRSAILTSQNTIQWIGPSVSDGGETIVDLASLNSLSGIKKVKGTDSGNYCVITSQNTLKCWGDNQSNRVYNSLGLPKINALLKFYSVATDVPGVTNVKDLHLSENYGCIITLTDTVRCWGDGNFIGKIHPTPLPAQMSPAMDIPGLKDVKQLTGGQGVTYALMNDGTVKRFGIFKTISGVPVDVVVPVD